MLKEGLEGVEKNGREMEEGTEGKNSPLEAGVKNTPPLPLHYLDPRISFEKAQ